MDRLEDLAQVGIVRLPMRHERPPLSAATDLIRPRLPPFPVTEAPFPVSKAAFARSMSFANRTG